MRRAGVLVAIAFLASPVAAQPAPSSGELPATNGPAPTPPVVVQPAPVPSAADANWCAVTATCRRLAPDPDDHPPQDVVGRGPGGALFATLAVHGGYFNFDEISFGGGGGTLELGRSWTGGAAGFHLEVDGAAYTTRLVVTQIRLGGTVLFRTGRVWIGFGPHSTFLIVSRVTNDESDTYVGVGLHAAVHVDLLRRPDFVPFVSLGGNLDYALSYAFGMADGSVQAGVGMRF